MSLAKRTCLVLGWCLSPLLLVAALFGGDRAINAECVLRGVWLEDVALSGLHREAARSALQHHFERLTTQPIRVRVGTQTYLASPSSLGFRIDLERTLDAAFAQGRQPGFWDQLGWWFERWRQPAPILAVGTVNPQQLAVVALDWERQGIPDSPFAGSVKVQGDTIQVELPRSGRGIHQSEAVTLLGHAFARGERGVLEIPLHTVSPSLGRDTVEQAARIATQATAGPLTLISVDGPERLHFPRNDLLSLLRTRELPKDHGLGLRLAVDFDPEKLAELPQVKSLTRPPKDARFDVSSRDEIAIIPDEPGTRIDPEATADALMQAALSPHHKGILPVDRSETAKRTAAESAALGVRKLVAQFATFHPCCKPRVENIHRIADLLDGTVIRSGETFSTNAAVGPRSRKNGFVPAPTIEDGEMVDSLGGGISQFATTLFNAVFLGGYDIVERQPHSYYFSRYPMGHEATLSYPKPDLVFKNDTAAGMLIRCVYGEKFIRVKIYGDNGGRRVDVRVSDRFDVKRPTIELLPNRNLEPDDEKVKEAGSIGWSVTVFRNLTFADGTKREEKRKVTYNPRVRRVEVHPCRIPRGEPGWSGEPCPVPEEAETEAAPSIPQGIAPDSPLDEGF